MKIFIQVFKKTSKLNYRFLIFLLTLFDKISFIIKGIIACSFKPAMFLVMTFIAKKQQVILVQTNLWIDYILRS